MTTTNGRCIGSRGYCNAEALVRVERTNEEGTAFGYCATCDVIRAKVEAAEKVGIAKLTKTYGYYAKQIIRRLASNGTLLELDAEYGGEDGNGRRRPRRYAILSPLPRVDDALADLRKASTVEVDGLVEDAKSAVEELKDELQEWYDNLPENFQNGEKGEALQSAIDEIDGASIDNLSTPEMSDAIEEHGPTGCFIGEVGALSRSGRASEAAGMLSAAKEGIDQWLLGEVGKNLTKEARTEWENFADDLEQAADAISGIEFPGMF